MVIDNVTQNSADLEWKPSEKDGGTPITGYLVEYRTSSRTTWSKSSYMDATTTKYTASNLTEGSEYYFRVIAINAEGNSRPLTSSDYVKPMRELSMYFMFNFNLHV